MSLLPAVLTTDAGCGITWSYPEYPTTARAQQQHSTATARARRVCDLASYVNEKHLSWAYKY